MPIIDVMLTALDNKNTRGEVAIAKEARNNVTLMTGKQRALIKSSNCASKRLSIIVRGRRRAVANQK